MRAHHERSRSWANPLNTGQHGSSLELDGKLNNSDLGLKSETANQCSFLIIASEGGNARRGDSVDWGLLTLEPMQGKRAA